jgi:hypothetical protein
VQQLLQEFLLLPPAARQQRMVKEFPEYGDDSIAEWSAFDVAG